MANQQIQPLASGTAIVQAIFPVQGDGSSLTASLSLSVFGITSTPTGIVLVSAVNGAGQNVASNIASSTISGTNINVVFNAGFSTLYTLTYSVTVLQPPAPAVSVAQSTVPWVVTNTPSTGRAYLAAQTSYTVTAGKTLHIQSISVSAVNTTSLAQQFKIRMRQAASGFSVSSNIVWGTTTGTPTGSNASNSPAAFDFADGLEVAAGQIIGFSMINTISTNGTITVQMTGYEY